MSYPKFNRGKYLNNKIGKFVEKQNISEEMSTLLENASVEMENNEVTKQLQEQQRRQSDARDLIQRRQKYLNESNWYALKGLLKKLVLEQVSVFYDIKKLSEETEQDIVEEIDQEIEDQLRVEVPFEIVGDNGTVIPIKMEVSPETADAMTAINKIMDNNNGEEKYYMEPEQIEASAEEAVEQDAEENPYYNDKVEELTDDTVDIISKDQQLLQGMKSKMDELELRVRGTEEILNQTADREYEQPAGGTAPKLDGLVYDEEAGLLIDPETGELFDPETGEPIQEGFHREHKLETILETLAYKKASKMIKEDFSSYNRNTAIVGGLNSLVILKTFDKVFGKERSYLEIKRDLNIK